MLFSIFALYTGREMSKLLYTHPSRRRERKINATNKDGNNFASDV